MKTYVKNYPRPQLVRKNWENLNGNWNFAFDDKNIGEKEKWFENFPENAKTILVPFTYETKMSTIQDEKPHEHIWYQRNIQVDANYLKLNNMMLHFEGSDFHTKVWVNGNYAGNHLGGYSRFSFDITKFVHAGENDIVVAVEDKMDAQQPRGKQRWVDYNFGCWYIQTTGIWKTVWTEYVPKSFIERFKITPCLETETIHITSDIIRENPSANLTLETIVFYKEIEVNRCIISVDKTCTSFSIPLATSEVTPFGLALWTPESPELYDITFNLYESEKIIDTVDSYFGFREIRIENGNILLNGSPLYQRLILDQGYWEDSHLTPPSEEALIEDIDKIRALGYNGVRKHQKIEDERFLFWCDVKGMLVWSEFPASYEFSDYAVKLITDEWMSIVEQNYNHPSIITWTPFNESWGIKNIATSKKQQSFTEAIYYLTKTFDPMRPVIVNDGWEHTISDIITLHDYEEAAADFLTRYADHKKELFENKNSFNKDKRAFVQGYSYKGQPVIISEYGGIAFTGDDSGWGYGNKVSNKEDFIKRFDSITTAVKELPYVCGFCYTQVTDVQQEVNGLMDIQRNFKIEPDIIKEINERAVLSVYAQDK